MTFDTIEQVLDYFETRGGILWEPGKEGRVGWAVCPCCGKRELEIIVPEGEGDA